jgi:succinate dehydrogenase / fumarate reductase flavoprotein subunit
VFAAITEMLVHGADAGTNAADHARESRLTPVDESVLDGLQELSEQPLIRRDGSKPQQLRRRVQEAAHSHLGPIRNREELEEFVATLEKVRRDELPELATTSKSRIYNKEWIDALELTNIVQLLEISTRSALARTESRGVHYREDLPRTDNDEWLKESVVSRAGDGFEIGHRPVTVTSMTPPKGTTPYLDFVKQMMKAHSDTGGKH